MLVELRAPIDEATAGAIADAVAELATLEALVRWGFACAPAREVVEVVVQDEYSHDVVFRWDAGWYLVFDST